MTEYIEKTLLIFAGISLFIQMVAVMSLQTAAAYVFGGAAILFALMALIVCYLT